MLELFNFCYVYDKVRLGLVPFYEFSVESTGCMNMPYIVELSVGNTTVGKTSITLANLPTL